MNDFKNPSPYKVFCAVKGGKGGGNIHQTFCVGSSCHFLVGKNGMINTLRS